MIAAVFTRILLITETTQVLKELQMKDNEASCRDYEAFYGK